MSARASRGLAGIAAATATGAALRALGLGAQVPIDDEFHALRAGLRPDLDLAYLFLHNTLPEDPLSDFSSPLALWVRLLATTVGVDEWTLRAPMWLASVAVVALVGLAARRAAGAGAGVAGAWLAALCPLLVMYARVARPYALVALCGAVALLAADALRREASTRAAVALGAACALGVWWNAAAAPALGLALWLGAAPGLRARAGADGRRASRIALATAAGIGALLVAPALPALLAFARAKSAAAPASWTAWWVAARATAGVRAAIGDGAAAPAVVAFFGLAALGAATSLRRTPALAGVAIGAFAAQLGAFAWIAPYGGDDPLVIARYAIAALPGLLVLVAVGLDRAARALASPLAAAAATGAAIAGMAALGPLVTDYARENAYTSRPSGLAPAPYALVRDALPEGYARVDASMTVVEIPWVLEWPLALPADYQAIHGARVRTATGFWTFHAPGVRFATVARARGDALDLGGADAAIVHVDLVEEWKHATGAPLTMDPARLEEAAKRYRTDAAALDAALARSGEWRLASEGRFVRVWVPARDASLR